MQALTKKRFTFVLQSTPHHDDAKRELRISAIRSHATRMSYIRREGQVESSATPRVLHALRINPTTTRLGNENAASNDDASATQTSQQCPHQLVSRPSHRRQSNHASSHTRYNVPADITNGRDSYAATNKPDHPDPGTSLLSHATRQNITATTSIYAEGFLGIRVDPFNCVPQAADDRGVAFIIDWYNQNPGPSNDAACYVYNVANGYAQFMPTLTDDAFFHAGMGVIQFMYEQVRQPGSPPSIEVLKHRGLAMAKVRQRLTEPSTNPVEDLTMFSIIFLCLLDGAMGNLAAHKLHKRSLSAILANHGGLEGLPDGSILKASLLQFDTSWTLETGESVAYRRRPIVKCEENPDLANFYLQALPEPLQGLYRASALPHTQLEILYRAYKLSRLNYRDRMEVLSSAKRSTSRYDDFREADPCLDFFDCQFSELGKILSLTLIIYCYTAFGLRSLTNAQRVGRAELTRRIQLYTPISKEEEDGLIWMWVLAINAWATNDILQPQGVSLKTELQRTHARFASLPHVIEIGSKFLWTSDLTKSVERLWLCSGASA